MKLRKFFCILAVGFVALGTYSLCAATDIAYLSSQAHWTIPQRYRAVVHTKYFTGMTFLIPPIGILGAAHHSGRLLDASVDKNHPSGFTMRYLRRLVLRSGDCARKITAFENSMPLGQSTRTGTVVCEVFFGAGVQDSFQMHIMSNRVGNEVKTSFFVNGLGFIPTTAGQSPAYLVRNAGPLKAVLTAPLMAGDNFLRNLIKYDLAKPVWMNLTENPKTSYFSGSNTRLTVGEWKQRTTVLHRSGEGRSASEVFFWTIY
jgi:hypothetical protein